MAIDKFDRFHNPPGNSTSKDANAEASPQTGAWSFDGDAYVPESSDSPSDSADTISTDLADVEDFTSDELEVSPTEDAVDSSDQLEGRLPDWLYILLGFLIPGGLAGGFAIPWQSVGDKLLLLAAFRKREDQAWRNLRKVLSSYINNKGKTT